MQHECAYQVPEDHMSRLQTKMPAQQSYHTYLQIQGLAVKLEGLLKHCHKNLRFIHMRCYPQREVCNECFELLGIWKLMRNHLRIAHVQASVPLLTCNSDQAGLEEACP
jgi:hypothetical protein